MWNKLRDAVTGLAEQVGIEVPGLDSVGAAVSDLTGSAGDAASGVVSEVGSSDLAGSVTDLTGAADVSMGVTETVAGVAGEAPTTAGRLLDAIKYGLAP